MPSFMIFIGAAILGLVLKDAMGGVSPGFLHDTSIVPSVFVSALIGGAVWSLVTGAIDYARES